MKRMYFIAITPPAEIAAEVTAFKNIFATQYNSKAALRSPPHITIVPPFGIDESQHQNLLNFFGNLQAPVNSFTQKLENFGSFPNKRPVIFIQPEVNSSLRILNGWFTEVLIESGFLMPDKADQRAFHPHMTIAFKDLLPEKYEEAWPVFAAKKYLRRFEVITISLLRHDHKRWQVVSELGLYDSGK